jgi:hypothetical protein
MLYTGKRMTKDEIRKQNMEIIDGPYFGKKSDQKLSLKGKKMTLTKWIKQAEEYHQTVSKIYKEPARSRYYLGDFVYSWVVSNAKMDVEVLKEMRKELDEYQENDTYAGDCSNEGW